MLSVGGKQVRKDTFLVEFQPRTESKETRALRNGKRVSFIWSIMRCYGILSGCRLFWNCFAISFLSTRRFLFDNFFNQVYRFIFLNSFSTLWEKNVLSWKISEGTIFKDILYRWQDLGRRKSITGTWYVKWNWSSARVMVFAKNCILYRRRVTMISAESVNGGREIDTISKDIDLSLNIVVRTYWNRATIRWTVYITIFLPPCSRELLNVESTL